MFNLFAIQLLELLHGKKLVAVLADETEVTERTWRNRLTKGWIPSGEEIRASHDKARRHVFGLLKREGWSDEEANEIIGRNPSFKEGVSFPTANLIFYCSPIYGKGYDEALSLAVDFDRLSRDASDAFASRDIPNIQSSLLAASRWLSEYSSPGDDLLDRAVLDRKIQDGRDLDELGKCCNALAQAMGFHVLSCWDLCFCSLYFNGRLQAYPLFTLVMPRLAPDIEVEPGTLRFLRNGKPPKVGHFEKAICRLFNFLAVLIYWKKYRKSPAKVPPVKEMAIWFQESERRIVNWRDETTRFMHRDLARIFVAATGLDENGTAMGIPSPMLVAALLWSPLLEREDGKIHSWTDCSDAYDAWWRRNLERMTVKGFTFGEIPLPSCLTYQPEGNKSSELCRSSQSSGRSSHPRDSQ